MVPHDFQLPDDNTYNIAFVLQRSNSDIGIKTDASKCFHETFVAPSDVVIPVTDRTEWSKKTFTKTIEEPGYYHLYFSNCMENTHSSFELKTTMYNVDSDGLKVYLSTGLAALPLWFFFFTC